MPKATIADFQCGDDEPLLLIAGPCVLQTESLAVEIAGRLQEMCEPLALNFVFKASFDKANRTHIASPRGPGLEEGVRILGGRSRSGKGARHNRYPRTRPCLCGCRSL